MTELEKAQAGNFDAIDLNKLAEEIRIESQKYLAECRKCPSFEKFKEISIDAHMKPAENMVIAINAFLMKVTVQGALISQYAAALGHNKSSLLSLAKSPAQGMIAEVTEHRLSEAFSTISMRTPNTD